jgi:hypothetical protein
MAVWGLSAGPVGAATTNYVARDAVGANNGSSWTDAYTNIQTAIITPAIKQFACGVSFHAAA